MNTEKRDFDKEAASWDENPGRVRIAKDVARAILRQVALTHDMDIMDFGCGTGLLSIELQLLVHSVTGIDSSQGMLDIFNSKISGMGLKNVGTLLVDLEKGDRLTGSYDLVVSSMTVHHIREIESLFDQFNDATVPDGHLYIADLDPDDGLFHSDNTGVFHFGFDRNNFRKVFIKAGFNNVRDVKAAEIMKPVGNGETRRFTLFLMTGRK
ncbi:MAG: class I SAM-dependent methyltransferase [Deltaproteobacteria bacterium]|nr:class I SAM-dependent methyltransferase [Deltaproteobacteria bacterium]